MARKKSNSETEFETQTVKNEVVDDVDDQTKYFWKYLLFSYI